jgi:two-component system, NtrC family, sensor histidine kinase HydH
MFTGMSRIRVYAEQVLRRSRATEPDALEAGLLAMHQIMDLDLAIMLETYREDLVVKNRTAERLATIGQFAAGIGHELRNPLGVVESSVFLLRQHLGKASAVAGDKLVPTAIDPKVERHLDKIDAEVKHAKRTIDDLLELARNRPPRQRRAALSDLLTSSIAAAILPAAIDVTLSVRPGATGMVDMDQMVRVISNLLINASQAMNERGTIFLEAESDSSETRIRVRDAGPGVPEDLRHRVFEALFTTKAQGTGLGLALCRRIVEAHRGTLVLESSDQGASFLLTVPQEHPSEELP